MATEDDEQPDVEIFVGQPRKKEIDISGMPAPEVTDTRTEETEREFLERHFTRDQIEELRETVRFAGAGTLTEHEPTDYDVADVVQFFLDAGWTDTLKLPEIPTVEEQPSDEDEFDQIMKQFKDGK